MKQKSCYKIVFDTNTMRGYHSEDFLTNLNLKGLPIFLKEHDLHEVKLAIPEMVLREMVQQDLEAIEHHVKRIVAASKALHSFGVSIPKKTYDRAYLKEVKATYQKIIQDHGIEIISTPKLDQNDLIERAVKGKKPFTSRDNSNRSDKGFKDAVIWQTMLADSKKNPGISYIFCTENKEDFPQDLLAPEMSHVNPKGKFRIIGTVAAVKEFLDSEYSLRLDLQKLYTEIEDEVKRKAGSITVQLNKIYAQKQEGPYSISFSPSISDYSPWSVPLSSMTIDERITRPPEPKVYDIVDLEIRDIQESTKEGEYFVRAKFLGTSFARDGGIQAALSSWQLTSSNSVINNFLSQQETVIFEIEMLYQRKNRSVQVLTVTN